jgi:hypothetical protein
MDETGHQFCLISDYSLAGHRGTNRTAQGEAGSAETGGRPEVESGREHLTDALEVYDSAMQALDNECLKTIAQFLVREVRH